MRGALVILLLSIPCIAAADQAAVSPDTATHGCLMIPTSMSFNADCRPCERFAVSCSCPVDYYSLEIYDRWGVRVFSTYDITSQWDGSIGRSYLPVGCYAYVILYRSAPDSPLESHKGTVLFLH